MSVCDMYKAISKVKKNKVIINYVIKPVPRAPQLIYVSTLKRRGVFLLTLGWDAGPSQNYPLSLIHPSKFPCQNYKFPVKNFTASRHIRQIGTR